VELEHAGAYQLNAGSDRLLFMERLRTLKELYQSQINLIAEFASSFAEERLQGPLLMDPTTYYHQPTKLLIVGQETAGWSSKYENVEEQLITYRKFNLGEKANSPFWNITRRIEEQLGIQPLSCAWTNLNRYDQAGKPPAGMVLQALPSLDFLVLEEIQILCPDVCLFYTNRKNDHRLTALYPGLQFSDIEGLPSSLFARLTHAELPSLTLRTPHPKWMQLKRWSATFLATFQRLSNNASND